MVKTKRGHTMQCHNCHKTVDVPIYRHSLYGDCLRLVDIPKWSFSTETEWLCENCAIEEGGDE